MSIAPVQKAKCDNLMASVGYALEAWGKVEMLINLFFGSLSGMQERAKAGAVMDAVISFEARLRICNRLVSLNSDLAIEKPIWDGLSARLAKLYKKRHHLAHFRIVVKGNDAATSEPFISPFMSYEKWITDTATYMSIEQVNERKACFDEAHSALLWMISGVIDAKDSEGHPTRPSEEPLLIARIRALLVQNQSDTPPSTLGAPG